MLVTELIEKANKSLAGLIECIEDIPNQELISPKTIGEWSIKDVLSHITIWEEEAAKAFEIWKIGIEPDWSHIADLDEFNNTTVKQKRRSSVAKVIEQLKFVHNGVLENIHSVPESEYNNRGGVPRWLVDLITSHIDEHAEKIIKYKNSLEQAEKKTA
jgi:hypothetical protein